jgi:hypothetical protein
MKDNSVFRRMMWFWVWVLGFGFWVLGLGILGFKRVFRPNQFWKKFFTFHGGRDTRWRTQLEKQGLNQVADILVKYGIGSETDSSAWDARP